MTVKNDDDKNDNIICPVSFNDDDVTKIEVTPRPFVESECIYANLTE